jgi:glycosyltransferase involved in cell wall biosynthesis
MQDNAIILEHMTNLAFNPRILVLFGNVPLLGNERVNIETIDQLRQKGADVRFLIRKEWTSESIQVELKRRNLAFEFVPYFDAIRYGFGLGVWINNIFGVVGGSWALSRQIGSFNPTHLHVGSTAWVLNFLPALLVSRLPLIFRVGEMPARHHALWRAVWRYTCRRAAAFVCDSEFIRREIIAIGAPAERCEVVYAPAPSRLQPMVPTRTKSTSPLVVLYIGQISAHKGVDILVDVAERLVGEAPLHFLLAGDLSWNNPLGQSLERRVHERGLQDRIQFLGFVDDIEPLYAVARLHVAPTVSPEPYGLTVIEAKAHSVPSIVFPSGGLMELVEHGRDGWVCEEPNARSLEAAIRHYLDNPTSLVEQGEAAFRSSRERLRVQDYGERWAMVYAKCDRRTCAAAS